MGLNVVDVEDFGEADGGDVGEETPVGFGPGGVLAVAFDGEGFDLRENAGWDVVEDVGGEVVGAEDGEGPEGEVAGDLGVEGAACLGEDVKMVEFRGVGV